MVEQRVEVVEDVFLGDGVIGVMLAEFHDGRVLDAGDRKALGARRMPESPLKVSDSRYS
jgi:hypothetical protein